MQSIKTFYCTHLKLFRRKEEGVEEEVGEEVVGRAGVG